MKDLSKLARKIQTTSMKQIALELFEMDHAELSNLANDHRNSWEFNYEILRKWWELSRENNRSVSEFYIDIGTRFHPPNITCL